jgi:hypothetical protein
MAQLLDSQQAVLSVSGLDAVGNPVSVPSTGLSFSVDDESILTLTDNGDGTALVVTTGTLGTATVTVNDDPDGDGTVNFQGSLAIDVVSGEVTEISVALGEPTSRL